ncbi:Hypothetical protein CINCED_3A018939 [Cinara cedri]|uniref:Endonuclease/exonuclease/phosphatase n=1 Tax=Cinara cedri TaxID=506608 RepID=A0A5E4NFY9_9HEMI|nr:Hypothetical protein CINCED_3A018939 [Cinara cedri]
MPCSAGNCTNRSTRGYRLCRFPKDPKLIVKLGNFNKISLTLCTLRLRYALAIYACQPPPENTGKHIPKMAVTRLPGQGNLKTNNWIYFYSGGLDHQAGVGFIVSDKLLPNVKRFEAISDRIWYLKLKCKWYNLVIIKGYAPTEDKNEAVKNEFYERLETVCDLLPSSKVKILLVEFNIKIGQELFFSPTIGEHSLYKNSNNNGTRLTDFTTT